jgi:hypothetical protein
LSQKYTVCVNTLHKGDSDDMMMMMMIIIIITTTIIREGRCKVGCECLTVALHVCPVLLSGVMGMNFRIHKTLYLQ